MINFIKKYIYLIFAILIFIYLCFCDIMMTISISMNLCFITAIGLLILLYYIVNHPIDEKESSPSFFYIFVKTAAKLYFIGIFSVILFNVLYPKNSINEQEQSYDYIIVFGAGIANGKNEIMNTRLDLAISYAKKYKRTKFVLTGARGIEEPIEEAVYMRNYMVDNGIDDRRIIIDPFSVNTYENIYNSLNLIKKDVLRRNPRENIVTRPFRNVNDKFDLDFLNIGFMSSEFHITRINMLAKKLGIYRPYDIPCKTRNIFKPYLYVREDLSLFKAFVLNQIKI